MMAAAVARLATTAVHAHPCQTGPWESRAALAFHLLGIVETAERVWSASVLGSVLTHSLQMLHQLA